MEASLQASLQHILLLSLLLTPARHISFLFNPHTGTQANKAHHLCCVLFRFECHRCSAHSRLAHPLPSLTTRRGRQRSTSADSLSFNLQCRVSHAQVRPSPSDEQNKQPSPHNTDNARNGLNGHNRHRQWPLVPPLSTMPAVSPSPSSSWGGQGTCEAASQ